MAFIKIAIITLVILTSSIYSFFVGKYEIFPYQYIQAVKWTYSSKVRKTGKEITQFDLFTPNVDVVFLGDSITAGGHWHDMFPDESVANRGINGETIYEISLRLDEVIKLSPQKIFLMAGINDIYRQTTVENILSSFELTITELTNKVPGAMIYLESTLECSRNVCGSTKLSEVRKLNLELQKLSQEYKNVSFININQDMAEKDGLRKEFSKDGVHVNIYGYSKWRDILSPYVATAKK